MADLRHNSWEREDFQLSKKVFGDVRKRGEKSCGLDFEFVERFRKLSSFI